MYDLDEMSKINVVEIIRHIDINNFITITFKCREHIGPYELQKALQYIKEKSKEEQYNKIIVQANILLDWK